MFTGSNYMGNTEIEISRLIINLAHNKSATGTCICWWPGISCRFDQRYTAGTGFSETWTQENTACNCMCWVPFMNFGCQDAAKACLRWCQRHHNAKVFAHGGLSVCPHPRAIIKAGICDIFYMCFQNSHQLLQKYSTCSVVHCKSSCKNGTMNKITETISHFTAKKRINITVPFKSISKYINMFSMAFNLWNMCKELERS